jgi:hypothetical protein
MPSPPAPRLPLDPPIVLLIRFRQPLVAQPCLELKIPCGIARFTPLTLHRPKWMRSSRPRRTAIMQAETPRRLSFLLRATITTLTPMRFSDCD